MSHLGRGCVGIVYNIENVPTGCQSMLETCIKQIYIKFIRTNSISLYYSKDSRECVLTSFSPNQYKSDKNFYAFEPITLVPFEPKLIDTKLLNAEQVGIEDEIVARAWCVVVA